MFSYFTYIGWILLEDVSDARDLQELHVTLVLTHLHYRFVQVARGRVEHGLLTGHEQHRTPANRIKHTNMHVLNMDFSPVTSNTGHLQTEPNTVEHRLLTSH